MGGTSFGGFVPGDAGADSTAREKSILRRVGAAGERLSREKKQKCGLSAK